MSAVLTFLQTYWPAIAPLIYEAIVRLFPTKKNWSLLDLLFKVVGIVLPNIKKVTEPTNTNTPGLLQRAKSVVKDYNKKHIISVLFLLFSCGVFAQIDSIFITSNGLIRIVYQGNASTRFDANDLSFNYNWNNSLIMVYNPQKNVVFQFNNLSTKCVVNNLGAVTNYLPVRCDSLYAYLQRNFYVNAKHYAKKSSGGGSTFDQILVHNGIIFDDIPSIVSASTINPTKLIFRVTGVNQINTISVSGFTAQGNTRILYIIPDGAFSFGTSGNIAIASTAVVGKMYTLTYDAINNKWYPSYAGEATNVAVHDSIIANSAQYFYKTVFVDSAKIWNEFDTLIIQKPIDGTKEVIIDKMSIYVLSGSRYYDNANAMMMLHSDSIGISFQLINIVNLSIGTGTGSNIHAGSLTISLTNVDSIQATSLVISDGTSQGLSDDGSNNLVGDGTGTINYKTGALSLTWTTPPPLASPITASYTVVRQIGQYHRWLFWEYNGVDKTFFKKTALPYYTKNVSKLGNSDHWGQTGQPAFDISRTTWNANVWFMGGDLFYFSGQKNTTGNLKYKVIVKYHLETI